MPSPTPTHIPCDHEYGLLTPNPAVRVSVVQNKNPRFLYPPFIIFLCEEHKDLRGHYPSEAWTIKSRELVGDFNYIRHC